MRDPEKWTRPATHLPRQSSSIGPALIGGGLLLFVIFAAVWAAFP